MIHKEKKYLAATSEILSLYVDLNQRKVIEFEKEKINLIDDFIAIKSDGFPTYHFANVVDDHLMNILMY